MRSIFAAPAIILCAAAPIQACAAQAVPIPDTPAGRYASAFLDAFNSADAAQLERYNALSAEGLRLRTGSSFTT